jgi:LysM repeat protein/preprotein translocase subunit Sec61beta
MSQDRENEMNQIMREMSDDLEFSEESALGRRRQPPESGSNRSVLYVGMAVAVLVILVVIFLSGGGNGVEQKVVTDIQSRLDQIEKRLSAMDGLESRVSQLLEQENDVRQTISKTERSIAQLNSQLDSLAQKVAAVEKKAASAPAASQTAGAKPATGRHHVVQKGDTLYGIAKKYKTTVADLRRLNGLGPNDAIYPNQKLLVAKGG